MFNNDEGYCTTDLKQAENIPPLILNILIQLGPVIKYLALFTDVLMWKNPSTSLVIVLLWISLCTWTQRWLVFGLPCLYLVKLASNWFNIQMLRKRRETGEYKAKLENQDLNLSRGIQPAQPISLNDTLYHLQQIQTWWYSHCHWRNLSSYANQQIAHTLLIYIWPLWAMLNFVLGSHGILAIVGTWVLISCSPWYQMIQFALMNNSILYHYMRAFIDYNTACFSCLFTVSTKKQHSCVKTTPSSTTNAPLMSLPPTPSTSATLLKQKESYRCEISLIFEVYENQRWWFGLGWTESLLQNERDPWTDNQLKPIISKSEYNLPKETKTTLQDKDSVKKMTIKSWVWSDRGWWVDMTGELEAHVDRDGWQYGDNSWKHLASTPGPHSFTRQRKWCKRAKLIERQLVIHE